ncbi:MAG: methyltransferase domain-containing protein [Nanoarchaeota archaeon]|nr:methyltransferase domain-containing protein [Nanoarchaeota archaeon]
MSKELSKDSLLNITTNTWTRKTLVVAVELEIFAKIQKGIDTVQKIAEELNTNIKPIERLLNACVALGFLEKEGEIYKNTPSSEKLLVKESPSFYGDYILLCDKLDKNWDHLKESILKGEPLEHTRVNFEDPIFTRAMHNSALDPANVLSEELDLSSYKNLLDLGGGSGAYSIILTNKNKNLKATILELPKVCEVANEYIQKLGDKSRINTLSGDYLEDELLQGFDIVLLSQILHSHSVTECKELLKKIYDILPQDGLIIINEFLLNSDKTSPVFPALFSLVMFLETKGSSYTEEEIKAWLTECNFKDIRILPLLGPHTAIIAKK